MSKRKFLQFKLRTLIILVLIFAGVFGWLGLEVKQGRDREAAVRCFVKLGGHVAYEADESNDEILRDSPPGPNLLRKILGDQFFAKVKYVNFFNADVRVSNLIQLKMFTDLKWLYFGGSSINDAGLIHLRDMQQLKLLDLKGTSVTFQGVKELQKALPNCEIKFSSND